jgi:hypothetical protein
MSLRSDKLEIFAEIATTCYDNEDGDDFRYFDASDPENVQSATEFFNTELGFLTGREKDDLLEVWHRVCNDCRQTKLLFNAVKVLQDKYS